MKKFFFLLFVGALIFITAPVLAADGGDPPNPISLDMFTSFAALVAGIAAVTQVLKSMFNTSGVWTDLLSWFVGVALGLVGYFFNLGIFAEVFWYIAILYGLVAGFMANKGFDIIYNITAKK